MKKARAASVEVLSPRALNRALIARQMLLERKTMRVADAVVHLVGMQAQIPTDPYFGLWSRLTGFRPDELSDLIATRKAVRTVVMRGTLHLVAAADALELRALVQPALSRMLASTAHGKNTQGLDLNALLAAGRAALDEKPLTLAEIRGVLVRQWPKHDPDVLGQMFHYHAPLIQVPPRGLWGKGGAARVTTVEAWLGRPLAARPSAEAAVLRYLAAFGPASVMDAQAWAGLTRLGPVFEALRPKLVMFRDETGRELFDLADAPRPDPGTKTPPRALPPNGSVRSFLLDGFVAGFWKVIEAKGSATLILEPFATLAKKDLAALTAEGRRLLKFAAPEAAKTEVRLGEAY